MLGTGARAGDALVRHPDVKIVSFTGSTVTAQYIRQAAAPYCKKLSLEVSNRGLGKRRSRGKQMKGAGDGEAGGSE